MSKMALLEEILKIERQIKVLNEEHHKIEDDINDATATRLTLLLENELLNRQLDHQYMLNSHYGFKKTMNRLNQLKDVVKQSDHRAGASLVDLKMIQEKNRATLYQRFDNVEKVPHLLNYQRNDILAQKLAEITPKITVVAAELHHVSVAFKETQERWADLGVQIYDDEHLKSFILEQKRMNACLEVKRRRTATNEI